MAFRVALINQAKQILQRSSSTAKHAGLDVPRGYCAVYVGEQEKKRFVNPVSFFNKSSFQDLLSQAEEEYGFNHPTGGLSIPCRENVFMDLASRISEL